MRARVIAFYLPQFHPIPENNKWWGKGFTEWTNVGKAKKYFLGHYQPRIPADLGYYDLRVPETRKAQADMAREFGIEGFLYWHYWFGNGKRLLERPFNEVLSRGEPNYPFALAWANEAWKGFEHGLKNRNVLIEQLYPGEEDYIAHFNALLPAFKDERYIKIEGKPLFMVYKSHLLPNPKGFIDLWQKLAKDNGLSGIYFVAQHQSRKEHGWKTEQESLSEMLNWGFDSVNFVRLNAFLGKRNIFDKIVGRLNRIFLGLPLVYPYRKFMEYFTNSIDETSEVIPTIIPGWDHTPRSAREGLVMSKTTPELFETHIKDVLNRVEMKDQEHRLIFIKSWNEWAEGNYLEPDLKWGYKFLEALKRQIE